MMIDALLPDVPDNRSVKKGLGMDCMKSETQLSLTEFCKSSENQSTVDFSIIYSMVAKSNVLALSETEKNCSIESESTHDMQEEEGDAELDEIDPFQFYVNPIQNCDIPEPVKTMDCNFEIMVDASEIIKDALSGISETLKLSSHIPKDFTVTKVTDSTIEQLAEIIHVLRQIITALDSSSVNGVLPDVETGKVDKESTAQLSSVLRVEQFKIEMGAQMLGCSSEVQSIAAQKAEQLFTSGISQAVNPLTVEMPVEQMKKLFGDIINLSENMNPKAVNVQNTAENAESKGLLTSQKQSVLIPHLNTQVYRSILKIDSGAVAALKVDTGAAAAIKNDSGAVDALKVDTGAAAAIKNDSGAVAALKVDTGAAAAIKNDSGAVAALKIDSGAIVTGQEKVQAGSTSVVNVMVENKIASKEPNGDIVQVVSEIADDMTGQLSTEEISPDELELPMPLHKGSSPVDVSPKVTREHIPGFLSQNFDEKEVVGQIAGKLNTLNRTGITEVGIQLRPEALGEVKLRIRIEGDVVIARFQVESQQVKQIVENNIQTLKDALAQQNLHAASIEVSVSRENMERETTGWERHQDHKENERTKQHFSEGDVVPDASVEGWQFTRIETGKRYGTNSIEYFA